MRDTFTLRAPRYSTHMEYPTLKYERNTRRIAIGASIALIVALIYLGVVVAVLG